MEAFGPWSSCWCVCVDTRCSVCNECVLGFDIGVGSEFAVSDESAVMAVIGPVEGEFVGVCMWYTQYGWCVRC